MKETWVSMVLTNWGVYLILAQADGWNHGVSMGFLREPWVVVQEENAKSSLRP